MLVQNLLVFVLVLWWLITIILNLINPVVDDIVVGDEEPTVSDNTDYIWLGLYLAFALDIGAFFWLGVGLLLYCFGKGRVTTREAKGAMLAGGLAILWGATALVWRFVLPTLAKASTANLLLDIGGISGPIEDFLWKLRLILVLAIVTSMLAPVIFWYLQKFYQGYASARGWELVKRSKYPFLGFLFWGSLVNCGLNLAIFGPPLVVAMTGEVPTLFPDSEENRAMIVSGAYLIKFLFLTLIYAVGAVGLVQNSLGLVKPYRSAPPDEPAEVAQPTQRGGGEEVKVDSS